MAGRVLLLAWLVTLLLGGPGRGRAQAPVREPPTFEAGIGVTNLNVSVREGRGYVGGLTQADFAIYEDGVRQELSLFLHERLPISLVLIIDSSSSMRVKLGAAQKAAARFLGTLLPGDRAAVIAFNVRVETLADFTEDRSALEAAIARVEASGPTALHNALYVALKGLAHRGAPGELRRRAVVLLSDGEDTASLATDEQVIGLARKGEAGIYAISLRPDRSAGRPRREFSQAAYLLTTLAQESGGRVYFPESLSELDGVYERIAEELRTLYSIGYVSNNRKRDGKWRRIVVRVPRREGLEVRYRVGYFAPQG
jgi:Ca-activated chloride channel family protein